MIVPEGTITVRDSDFYMCVPVGTITVRDNDLYMTQTGPYIPEGIITVRDSDLCHVMIQTGSMSSTQTGPRYLYLYAVTTVSSL